MSRTEAGVALSIALRVDTLEVVDGERCCLAVGRLREVEERFSKPLDVARDQLERVPSDRLVVNSKLSRASHRRLVIAVRPAGSDAKTGEECGVRLPVGGHVELDRAGNLLGIGQPLAAMLVLGLDRVEVGRRHEGQQVKQALHRLSHEPAPQVGGIAGEVVARISRTAFQSATPSRPSLASRVRAARRREPATTS